MFCLTRTGLHVPEKPQSYKKTRGQYRKCLTICEREGVVGLQEHVSRPRQCIQYTTGCYLLLQEMAEFTQTCVRDGGWLVVGD